MRREITNNTDLPITARNIKSMWSTHFAGCPPIFVLLGLAMAGSGLAQNAAAPNPPTIRSTDKPESKQASSEPRLPGARLTPEQKSALAAYARGVEVVFNRQEVPSSLTGNLLPRSHPDDPAADAQAAMRFHGPAFRVGPDDGFNVVAIEADRSGMPRVRLAQTYKGLAVSGAELVIQLNRTSVTGISGQFVPDLNVRTDAEFNRDQAIESALAWARDAKYENPQAAGAGAPQIFVDDDSAGHLAIPVQLTQYDSEGAYENNVFVDASNGSVLSASEPKLKSQGGAGLSNFLPNLGFGNFLLNPSFESGSTPWIVIHYGSNDPSSVIIGCGYPAYNGTCSAWLNGWGFASEDILNQFVTVPSDALVATLSFMVRIDTNEPTGPSAPLLDTLDIRIRDNNGGTTLYQLGTLSNKDSDNSHMFKSWSKSFDATRLRGQKIQVYFDGREGKNGVPTSFYIDSTSLTFTHNGPGLP